MGRLSGPRTLQELPRFDRGWTFLYVQQARIEREEHGIAILDERGIVPVPVAVLSVLMLGPGTTVTHAAMEVLSENGCSVLWTGEGGVRFYAAGHADTERAANLQWQAEAWADEKRRMDVIRRMYAMRFREPLDPSLTLQQIRGREGVRVREAYASASRRTGVEWTGRNYDRREWHTADPVNRALSAANACLYGLVHAAIVATGFSPGLGFIHQGKRLAFVYDIADLYKVELTVPIAFEIATDPSFELEQRVRRAMRDAFYEEQLLTRLVPDIQRTLGLRADPTRALVHEEDEGSVLASGIPKAAW
jgi:CRISP-associated protein Cas1